MKISKYQFDKNVVNEVSFDDFHEALEDAMAVYKINNQRYIVICIDKLKEDNGQDTYVVFKYNGFLKELLIEEDINIVNKVLELYEND